MSNWYDKAMKKAKENKTNNSAVQPQKKETASNDWYERAKAKAAEKKVEEKKIDVFFKIASSTISETEKAKIQDMISFLKANPNAKVQVTGYADSGTGNHKINMKYSQNRADVVVKALKEGGIAADRITSEAKGDTVQPFAENDMNRVAICIAK